MTSIFFIVLLILLFFIGIAIIDGVMAKRRVEKRKPKFVNTPAFKAELDAAKQQYMKQTILALWNGSRPPRQVGEYIRMTKKKLITEWNDEWQAEMDKLAEYYDINYDILFGIDKDGYSSIYHEDDNITYKDWIHTYAREEKESSKDSTKRHA